MENLVRHIAFFANEFDQHAPSMASHVLLAGVLDVFAKRISRRPLYNCGIEHEKERKV